MTGRFQFTREQLDALAKQRRESFLDAEPFPHVVLHDLIPVDVLRQVVAEFPRPDEPMWRRYRDSQQTKLASEDIRRFGDTTRELITELNGPAFLNFLERLTGIEGLIPDPYLRGGGLHQIERGGHLDVHVDFDLHERLHLARRLNLLIYLNEDWLESWGGSLELWDRDLTGPRVTIPPTLGTAALFATDEGSYHGHPKPLECPREVTRRSVALYYYTAPVRPPTNRHTTRFTGATGAKTWRERVRPFVPPILIDLARRARTD